MGRGIPYKEELSIALKDKVRFDGKCYIWTGGVKNGIPMYDGRPIRRQAWVLTHGKIPHKIQIKSSCDKPLCVSVEHLYKFDPYDKSQVNWEDERCKLNSQTSIDESDDKGCMIHDCKKGTLNESGYLYQY